MEVIEGKWFVKGLKQSGREGIRMCFCETKVELGKVGVLYEVKEGGHLRPLVRLYDHHRHGEREQGRG